MAGALSIAVDFANSGRLEEVWKYVIAFSAYIVVDLLIDVADQAVRLKITKQTMVALKTDVYRKLSRMCCVHFFQHNTADYLSNMTTDAETLRDSYFYTILHMYADFLRCGVAILILMWLSPILGGFVLGTSLLQALIPIFYAKKLEKAGKLYSDAQERQMKTLKENLSAFLTAKTFHIEKKLEQNYIGTLESAEEFRRRSKLLKEWTSSLSYVFNQISHLGVFLLGAVLVIQGVITVAEIVAASELIVYISYPILWLNGDFADLRTAKEAAKKLQAHLQEEEDEGGTEGLFVSDGNLAVQELSFSYNERAVLKNVSFHFSAGKKYLILGSSGSGKSTFLNLIAGLRTDYSGGIYLSGVEIRQLSRYSLTKNLCVINQEPFLFDDTLFNNVCLYEDIDEEQVLEALHRVELGHIVEAMPDGIHAFLGENAAALSGGEKQRVVIARALVRNTPVLLLDESTSHLDPATAADIERIVLGLKGVTVLLVSHNATDTAKKYADEILEMQDGKLQNLGSS